MSTASRWPAWNAIFSVALLCGVFSALWAPLTCILLLLAAEDLTTALFMSLPWIFVLLAVAGFAIGTCTGMVIGVPLLMILGRLGWLKQQVLVPLGAGIGLLDWIWINEGIDPRDPLMIVALVVGGICGGMAHRRLTYQPARVGSTYSHASWLNYK